MEQLPGLCVNRLAFERVQATAFFFGHARIEVYHLEQEAREDYGAADHVAVVPPARPWVTVKVSLGLRGRDYDGSEAARSERRGVHDVGMAVYTSISDTNLLPHLIITKRPTRSTNIPAFMGIVIV